MQISGTKGNDQIDGSGDPDDIDGEAGDDSIYGHDGDDDLFGDEGDDTLAGGSGRDTLDGGAGKDVLWTGKDADTVVLRDGYGNDVVMDFTPGEDVVRISSDGIESWKDVQARLGSDWDGTAILKLDDGTTLRFEGLKPDELGEKDFVIDPPPVCFAEGTMIDTPCGPVPVQSLRPGDCVLTLDSGPQPVLWIGRRETCFGHGQHRHQPVVIPQGAMGHGLPLADLFLSPQHRVLIRGGAGRPQGALARAKGLCGEGGIAQDRAATAVVYFQVLLPAHALVLANGLPCETFYPGPFALETLPRADRIAVEAMFPGVMEDAVAAYGPPARPVLSLRQIRDLPRGARLARRPGIRVPA
jgi:Hint domain/RTX calcium-binding nonapeptide repeat (4 copies)